MSRRSATTTKVFVGSLPGGVTAEDLRRLFAPYGPIAECDIANRCGFLHLEDKDLAMKAIEELNNTNFMGTRISVEKGRIKPPRSRREAMVGGPTRGGRERSGPYPRDGYRGPPRDGGYGREYGGYDRYDYDRGAPPRDGYDSRYPDMGGRRDMYDDRSYDDRRPYPNGYDRRAYPDDRSYGDPSRAGYDDRRLPTEGYDDRRRMDDQTNGGMRGPAGYDRGSGSDMYSRRDAGPKPLLSANAGGYTDRSVGGYTSTASVAAPYGAVNSASGTAMGTAVGGYASTAPAAYGNTAGGYAPTMAGGYGDVRSAVPPTYGAPAVDAYNTSGGGYGDAYNSSGMRTGGYDTTYPIQQRSFSSGTGPGVGARRDVPPARRY